MPELLPIIEKTADYNSLFVVGILLIVVVLQIIVKLVYPDFYKLILYRLFVENLSGRQLPKRVEVSVIQFITLVKAVLVLSLMAFVTLCYTQTTELKFTSNNEWQVLLYIIGIASAYLLLKFLINSILAKIFFIRSQIDYYNALIIDVLRILGIILLPVIAFSPFLEIGNARMLIFAGIAIIVLFVVFQYVTMFLYLFKNKFLNHYSILYFCAVEILPVLVLLKLVF